MSDKLIGNSKDLKRRTTSDNELMKDNSDANVENLKFAIAVKLCLSDVYTLSRERIMSKIDFFCDILYEGHQLQHSHRPLYHPRVLSWAHTLKKINIETSLSTENRT